jgi:peroxiredoxin
MNLFGKRSQNRRNSRAAGVTSAALPAGVEAPDFTLVDQDGQPVRLADFRDRPVILAFYPADWSSVCGEQMSLYNEVLPLFETHDAQLLGLSVDGRWSHRAFADHRNLRFPLLSDFEPKGEVARTYGVFDTEGGVSQRALFVVDSQGVIQWSHVSPPSVNPGANGILNALESLNEGAQVE